MCVVIFPTVMNAALVTNHGTVMQHGTAVMATWQHTADCKTHDNIIINNFLSNFPGVCFRDKVGYACSLVCEVTVNSREKFNW